MRSIHLKIQFISLLFKQSQKISKQPFRFIDYKIGRPENMFVNQKTIPIVGQDHLLMKIKAIGINRAELLHRAGKYPINNEQEQYLGLQAAGQLYHPQTKEKLFDGMALLSGGSYAQWAKVPKTHVMPLPSSLNFVQGAAIPEAWLTAFQILSLAELKNNQSVAIYAGASGVGTAALQICRKVLKCNPYSVVSNKSKADKCIQYGAHGTVLYKDNQHWADELIKQLNSNNSQQKQTKKFDAVLDCVCSSNVNETIKLLKTDGRWILYGTLSGVKGQMNFGQLLAKRIKITTTTLKSRSKLYKDNLISDFSDKVLPKFVTKQVSPVIHQVLKCNWKSAQSFIHAHKILEGNQNSGKIVIQYED